MEGTGGYLEIAVLVNQNVRWLEVAVNDARRMDIFESSLFQPKRGISVYLDKSHDFY